MMGQHARSESLFYYFRLEDQVQENHLLRLVDRYIDFGFARERLRDSYSDTGRPSIDPALLLRIVLIGYLYGISSERNRPSPLGLEIDKFRQFTSHKFSRLGTINPTTANGSLRWIRHLFQVPFQKWALRSASLQQLVRQGNLSVSYQSFWRESVAAERTATGRAPSHTLICSKVALSSPGIALATRGVSVVPQPVSPG